MRSLCFICLLLTWTVASAANAPDCSVSRSKEFLQVSGKNGRLNFLRNVLNDPAHFKEDVYLLKNCNDLAPVKIPIVDQLEISFQEMYNFPCVTTLEDDDGWHIFAKSGLEVTAKGLCKNEDDGGQLLSQTLICHHAFLPRDMEFVTEAYTTEVIECDDCSFEKIQGQLAATVTPERLQQGDIVSIHFTTMLQEPGTVDLTVTTLQIVSPARGLSMDIIEHGKAAVKNVNTKCGAGYCTVLFKMERLHAADPFQTIKATLQAVYFPTSTRRQLADNSTQAVHEEIVRSLEVITAPKIGGLQGDTIAATMSIGATAVSVFAMLCIACNFARRCTRAGLGVKEASSPPSEVDMNIIFEVQPPGVASK